MIAVAGWRRWLFAFSMGALAAAALPPFYILPVLWLSFSGLAYLNLTANCWRQAFFEGWLFGVGWFGAGLYWVGHAFLVDAERYVYLMPFAVIGIAIGMAIFIAISSVSVNVIARRFKLDRFSYVFLFAGCWILLEWFRSWILTGFPWNPLGSVWGSLPEMMQVASYIGTLGLSFMTAVVFAAPIIMVANVRPVTVKPWIMVLALSLTLPAIWGVGAWRLSAAHIVMHDDILLRLVQPVIPQALKWKSELRQQHVLKQMAMSNRTAGPAGKPTHVIWAETNVPYLIDPNSPLPSSLAAAVPRHGALIFGAPRRDEAGKVYNSMFAIDDEGAVQATFDKFYLVPFGEYVPFRGILPLEKLTAGRGDFTPGFGPQTLAIRELPPFAALICYEVIFSGQIVNSEVRPEWILNITNDAWFGPSSGPRQHLVQAQLRAIEEGLSLVRVANTGISAVIDPYGRIIDRIELDQSGVLDSPLPKPLAATVFSAFGQRIGLGIAIFAILISAGFSYFRNRH